MLIIPVLDSVRTCLCAVLHCAVLSCPVLCCTVLYCTVLYCAVLVTFMVISLMFTIVHYGNDVVLLALALRCGNFNFVLFFILYSSPER